MLLQSLVTTTLLAFGLLLGPIYATIKHGRLGQLARDPHGITKRAAEAPKMKERTPSTSNYRFLSSKTKRKSSVIRWNSY
jgi:hypothetical protein